MNRRKMIEAYRGRVAKGYRLIDVRPVNMSPQTFHIESVAVLAD